MTSQDGLANSPTPIHVSWAELRTQVGEEKQTYAVNVETKTVNHTDVYNVTNLAFLEASGRSIFTATRRGRPFLTLKGNSRLGRSWGFSISHRCTFYQQDTDTVKTQSPSHPPTTPLTFSSNSSPPQTVPLPVSPWRWETVVAAPAAGRHRPRGWTRPRRARRKCCYRWHPAGSQCLPQHSGGRWEAVGETRGETGRGKEGSQGRGEAPLELGGNPSPSPCPSHRLEGGRQTGWMKQKDYFKRKGTVWLKTALFCFKPLLWKKGSYDTIANLL